MGHLSHIKENGSITSKNKKTTTHKTNGRTEFIAVENSRKWWQFYAFIISLDIQMSFIRLQNDMQIVVRRSRLAFQHKYHRHKSTRFNQFVARFRLEHVHQYTWCKFFCSASHISFQLNSRQTLDFLFKNTVEFEIGYKTNCILFKQKKMGFLEKKSFFQRKKNKHFSSFRIVWQCHEQGNESENTQMFS